MICALIKESVLHSHMLIAGSGVCSINEHGTL